jgi:hypothetical protein
MVLHKTISIEMERVSGLIFREIRKKGVKILIVEKYILLLISSRNNVIKSSRKMYTGFTSHENKLPQDTFASQ